MDWEIAVQAGKGHSRCRVMSSSSTPTPQWLPSPSRGAPPPPLGSICSRKFSPPTCHLWHLHQPCTPRYFTTSNVPALLAHSSAVLSCYSTTKPEACCSLCAAHVCCYIQQCLRTSLVFILPTISSQHLASLCVWVLPSSSV